MKLKQILAITVDEESTVNYLREERLLASTMRCPKCRELMPLVKVPENITSDQEIFKCSKRNCRKIRSIRHRSFFSKSKLKLSEAILLMHLWAKKYSQNLIIDDFDFAKQTVTDWARFCRDLCVERFDRMNHTMIGGPGKIVEIDESLLVKRKFNKGRLLKQQWIFGGIERSDNGEKRFFIEFVDERTESVLIPIIQRRIAPGTKIISDGWRSYSNLSNLGYSHSVIVHEDNFVHPNDSTVHTQNVESMWSVLKRFLRKHGCHRSPHEFEYIAEFFFRWGNNDIFTSFLDLIKNKYQLN